MIGAFSQLGDVAEFINGAAFKPSDWSDTGKKIIRIQNLTDKSKPYNRTHREVGERFHVQQGDLLVSWSATLGVFEWDEPEIGLLNQHIFRVRPDIRKVDKRYLRHALELALLDMRKHLHGATMLHVNRGEFLSTKLYLPPIHEQIRVAAILDQADALRVKRAEAIAQLDSLTQSIFIEMFGDPATNPKGFTRRSLGELIKFEGGSQPPASTFTSEPSPENIRLVQIRDFKSDRFMTFIPRKLAKRFFEKDDVMIGRYGPPVFQILKGLSGSYNVALMKAVPRENVTKNFVYYLLQEKGLHHFVVANSERTAGQSGVNLELLEKYQAYQPPLKLQNEFSERIDILDKLKEAQNKSLIELDCLFASLQHRAFQGEL